MYGCIITMKSLTHALRGEALLKKRGIDCKVVKPPSGTNGCRYGIALSCSAADFAMGFLIKSGLDVGKLMA